MSVFSAILFSEKEISKNVNFFFPLLSTPPCLHAIDLKTVFVSMAADTQGIFNQSDR